MTEAVRYYTTLLSRRQTVLAPALVFLALLGMVYASDAGPPLAAAAVPAASLVPLAAWIIWLCATSESRAFAEVTLVALGSSGRRLLARCCAAAVVVAALSAVACLWAIEANPHPYPASVIATIAAMNLACGVAGIGLGAVIAPPVRTTAGAATLAVTAVVTLSLIVAWLPPLGPLLHTFLPVRSPTPIRSLVAIGQAVALGAVLLALAHVRGRRAG